MLSHVAVLGRATKTRLMKGLEMNLRLPSTEYRASKGDYILTTKATGTTGHVCGVTRAHKTWRYFFYYYYIYCISLDFSDLPDNTDDTMVVISNDNIISVHHIVFQSYLR